MYLPLLLVLAVASARKPMPPSPGPGWIVARGALTATPDLGAAFLPNNSAAAAQCKSLAACVGFTVRLNASLPAAPAHYYFKSKRDFDIYNYSDGFWSFLRPPPVFRFGNTLGDHAVLQQAPAHAIIWGFARPGNDIQVRSSAAAAAIFSTRSSPTTGRWQVRLPPVHAEANGSAVTVTATAANTTITLKDLVYGDVWLCSGQ